MAETPSTDTAFRTIFDATFEEVRRFCMRRLSGGDVNDAVAEVYLVAWRKLDQVPDGDEALPWLFAVARNVVRNTERGNRRTTRLRARLAREPASAPAEPLLPLIRQAEYDTLAEALADLSASDREVIRLHAWEDLPAPAIAATLGCSVAAAEKRLSRAVNRLRQRYAVRTAAVTGRRAESGGGR